MKKYLFIIAAAATFMLVACNKEKELRAPEEEVIAEENLELPGYTYITAVGENEEDSKARIDGTTAHFAWSANCQIAVFANGTYHLSTKFQNASGAGAKFVFAGGINAYRSDFAVYPSYLVHDGTNVLEGSASNHTAASLKITLPASYTLAQVLSNESPTPMIAVNNPFDSLEFKSICALLRITVKFIPKDAEYLKVVFPGKKVNGEFTLTNFTPGTDGLPVVASTSAAEEIITITDLGISAFTDQLIINVPVPVGKLSDSDYPYVRVEAYDNTDHKINGIDAPIKTVDSAPVVWNPNRKTSRTTTAKLPYFTSNANTPTRVVFAPGNLQGTITTKATDDVVGKANNWKFANHQYDALGASKGNKFSGTNVPIDLFAWIGASATYSFADDEKYGLLTPHNSANYPLWVGNAHPETLKYDWSDLFNGVSYPVGTWRLPNGDKADGENSVEWARLTSGRNLTYSCCKATLLAENGTDTLARGLIIFPDTYTHPVGVHALVKTGKSAANTAHYKENVITLAEWDILEKVGGCAFLPVGSSRIRNSGNNVTDNAGDAAYWACYSNSTNSAAAMVSSDVYVSTKSLNGSNTTDIQTQKSSLRRNGCAVRLIRDVN